MLVPTVSSIPLASLAKQVMSRKSPPIDQPTKLTLRAAPPSVASFVSLGLRFDIGLGPRRLLASPLVIQPGPPTSAI